MNEVRQHNPPSTWAVHVTNRELQTVASFTIIAAVVDITGEIKAIQALPAIRNLKPGQVQRRETRIRVTVIAPTDRVVFYVRDVISETGNLRASEIDVAAMIKSAASKLPAALDQNGGASPPVTDSNSRVSGHSTIATTPAMPRMTGTAMRTSGVTSRRTVRSDA